MRSLSWVRLDLALGCGSGPRRFPECPSCSTARWEGPMFNTFPPGVLAGLGSRLCPLTAGVHILSKECWKTAKYAILRGITQSARSSLGHYTARCPRFSRNAAQLAGPSPRYRRDCAPLMTALAKWRLRLASQPPPHPHIHVPRVRSWSEYLCASAAVRHRPRACQHIDRWITAAYARHGAVPPRSHRDAARASPPPHATACKAARTLDGARDAHPDRSCMTRAVPAPPMAAAVPRRRLS
ncbi:hypothetical protein HYPSUDRAFT_540899 [Hypholoma sublateritium FD-334 SS-4]|uniref:Uncharacterized protein n=1 Tax=Hypholoma sublateritium (strain FD-334 SS-4) TaxID=945553 RepID=A0A0D2PY18_HYPSF|nr:hypothetical protein HYPSUDRAFT_540899 [Hypholoma sublateritium FD-334 SS-4]